jgi:hypothetical protein
VKKAARETREKQVQMEFKVKLDKKVNKNKNND